MPDWVGLPLQYNEALLLHGAVHSRYNSHLSLTCTSNKIRSNFVCTVICSNFSCILSQCNIASNRACLYRLTIPQYDPVTNRIHNLTQPCLFFVGEMEAWSGCRGNRGGPLPEQGAVVPSGV